MLKTTRFLLTVLALFSASINLQSQTLVWKNRFPTIEGYQPRQDPYGPFRDLEPRDTNTVEKFIGYIGQRAGDGLGGSVWTGNFVSTRFLGFITNYPTGAPFAETVAHYDSTNIVRVLWMSGNGVRIFTNDMQFSGRTSETNSYSSYNGYIPANVTLVRCSTNEIHFQVSNRNTNFIRRITRANTGFSMKTVPLEKDEQILPDNMPLSDTLGFTSFNPRNFQIKRYSIR